MQIIIQENFGEEKAVVIDDNKQLQALYIKRPERLNLGDEVQAIIRSKNISLKGYFAQTADKKSIFIRSNELYAEGQHICVKITKEARTGKDANGIIISSCNPKQSLYQQLQEQYRISPSYIWDEQCDIYFDKALSPRVILPNGSILHIERTQTCWTIDVDSGTNTQEPKKINAEILPYIYQEITTRHLGGVILIDFIGSNPKSEQISLQQQIKTLFDKDPLTTPLGWTRAKLFEIKRTRTYAPLTDVFYSQNEELSDISITYQICQRIKHMKRTPTITAHPIITELLRPKISNIASLIPNPCYNLSQYDIQENL